MTIDGKSSRPCSAVGHGGNVSEQIASAKALLLAVGLAMLAAAGVAARAGPLRRFELRAGSPAFWNLIGRTPLRLFDPDENPPTLLRAGDRVRFRVITRDEFAAFAEATAAKDR